MKETVRRRSQHDTDIGDKGNAAEQCVKGGEQLSCRAFDLYYRAHPAEDKRGIVNGIYPGDIIGYMVACNADEQA